MTKLEDRVTHLEQVMPEIRRDARDARTLASAAHEDVGNALAKLNAHTKLLEAVRITQLEHHAATGRDISKLNAELHSVRAEMHNMRGEMHDSLHKMWHEVGSLRTDMHDEVGSLRTEMHDGFAKLTELITGRKNDAD